MDHVLQGSLDMSPVEKNDTDMTLSSQILESASNAVTTAKFDDDEHTATGIPIPLLWMPYVGFSFILVVLMVVSFLHYHRKHGHKYHHHQQFWGNEMSVASVLGNIQQQVSSIGKRAGRQNSDNTSETRFKFGRDSRRNKDGQPRSKAIGYRGVEEYVPPDPPPNPQPNMPPNGGLQINRSMKPDIVDSNRKSQRGEVSYHRQLPSQPTQQPLPNPHRPGHRSRPRNAHCDEPSTSSSTVSSKTSNQSAKPGGGRNKTAHNRRHKRPLVFEANENGSMVDIRLNVKTDSKTVETRPNNKDRSQSMQSSHNPYSPQESSTGLKAQKHNPSYRYSVVNSTDTENVYRSPGENVGERRRKLPSPNYLWTSSNTNTNPNKANYKYSDLNPEDFSAQQQVKSSCSTSLPVWSTMPLCAKPPAPRRDFYSYPFTPSGHMEMLSDTENDEVFLLQHTKL